MPDATKTRKPVETLDRKVAARGPHHAAALKVLSQSDPAFKTRLRGEEVEADRFSRAQARVTTAKTEFEEATKDAAAMKPPTDPNWRKLDALAASIAAATK